MRPVTVHRQWMVRSARLHGPAGGTATAAEVGKDPVLGLRPMPQPDQFKAARRGTTFLPVQPIAALSSAVHGSFGSQERSQMTICLDSRPGEPRGSAVRFTHATGMNEWLVSGGGEKPFNVGVWVMLPLAAAASRRSCRRERLWRTVWLSLPCSCRESPLGSQRSQHSL